jgi:host factor-I protein
VKLHEGENISGWIEYYDKNKIGLTRENAPNLFIFKHEIMYIAETR